MKKKLYLNFFWNGKVGIEFCSEKLDKSSSQGKRTM